MSMILDHIEQMKAYVSAKQPSEMDGAIRLNLNENPYPPSKEVRKVFSRIAKEDIRVYPDALCEELRNALAEKYQVKPEQILCGNGSSEIITLIFQACIGANSKIAIPDPSFAFYHTAAVVRQAQIVNIPTRDDFSIDIDLLINSGADAVVLVNPNAPTGRCLAYAEVERLVRSFSGLVIIDEAYIDFADEQASAVSLISSCRNVIVVRTFSKSYSLCGARVGYCFADEKMIGALLKVKTVYNVNWLSQQLALAALSAQNDLAKNTSAIRRTREFLTVKLQAMGFSVIPSQTNFVLCTPPERIHAKELYERLLEKHIYVRYYDQPRLSDKLRISIGTSAQVEQLCNEIERCKRA
ncbi:Histidinol-phosphate aminotransferase [compost metagenome]